LEQWIKDLHKNKRCTAFAHDLIDLVVHDMLIVEHKPSRSSSGINAEKAWRKSEKEKKRISASNLAQRIEVMIRKGEKDPEYYTKGVAFEGEVRLPPTSVTVRENVKTLINLRDFPGVQAQIKSHAGPSGQA